MIPVFRTNLITKICHRINIFFNHATYVCFVRPVLFVLPISFILMTLADSELCKQLGDVIGSRAADFLQKSQLMLVFMSFALITIGSSLENLIKAYATPDCELLRDDLHSILNNINGVVGSKKSRFLKVTKLAILNRWGKEKIFLEITQPEQQIALLVKALHGIFEYLFKNKVNFRVGLMRVADNKPSEWFCFEPEDHPPRTSAKVLSAPTSAIMKALKTKEMVIVSDLQDELKKKSKEDRNFIKGSSDLSAEGSLLTFPIYCPNTKNPIYVLSVLAKQKKCLDEKNKELYFWIIDIFLSRILLEHHLMLLKNQE